MGTAHNTKNKTAFYITSNHDELLGPKADWNYFESGHGKGACDGIGELQSEWQIKAYVKEKSPFKTQQIFINRPKMVTRQQNTC